MKGRLTFLSLALNVVLLAVILFMRQKPLEKLVAKPDKESFSDVVTQIVETVQQSNSILPESSKTFDWSQIASKDFVIYAENLRGIGCPEQTVRDLLTGEIEELFVNRRQDLFLPVQNQFWNSLASGGRNNDFIDSETKKKVEALEEEKQTLLKKIFHGGNEDKNPGTTEYETILADSLSSEKIQQFHDTVEKCQKLTKEINSSDLPQAEKEKQYAELNQKKVAEEKAFLSSEELAEFELRKSSFAQQRGNNLGFDASEEELRAMARLTMNEKPIPTDQKSPDYKAKLAEHREQKEKVDQQMKALLGENRFSEYERSKDSEFQNIYQIGRRYDLPSETISEVYELSRSTLKEVRAFKKANVESDERDAALEAIRRQTEQTMISKLGARAAETYRKNFNNWDEIPDP